MSLPSVRQVAALEQEYFVLGKSKSDLAKLYAEFGIDVRRRGHVSTMLKMVAALHGEIHRLNGFSEGVNSVRSAPAVSAPASTPFTPAVIKPTRQQLYKIAVEVLGASGAPRSTVDLSYDDLEKLFFQSHLRFPGMTADSVLSEKHRRPSPDRLSGFERSVRVSRQQQIDALFNGANKNRKDK